MPIQREHRHHYGPHWRKVIRPLILARAGDKCEACRVPNGAMVARVDALPGWWFSLDGEIHDATGRLMGDFNGSELDVDRLIAIRLSVSHKNHTPGDDGHENLQALCQACHLKFDKARHAETRAIRKDAERPLLAAIRRAFAPDIEEAASAWGEKFEAMGKGDRQ